MMCVSDRSCIHISANRQECLSVWVSHLLQVYGGYKGGGMGEGG